MAKMANHYVQFAQSSDSGCFREGHGLEEGVYLPRWTPVERRVGTICLHIPQWGIIAFLVFQYGWHIF